MSDKINAVRDFLENTNVKLSAIRDLIYVFSEFVENDGNHADDFIRDSSFHHRLPSFTSLLWIAADDLKEIERKADDYTRLLMLACKEGECVA